MVWGCLGGGYHFCDELYRHVWALWKCLGVREIAPSKIGQ